VVRYNVTCHNDFDINQYAMQRTLSTLSGRGVKPAILLSAPSKIPFPFSQTAKAIDRADQTALPPSLLKGTSLMTHLRETIPSGYTKELLSNYFNSRSPGQLLPGSVLSVTSDGGSFAGVLISVRHKGVDSSFTLRNIIQRTGVEMRFNVGSPLIKEVKVISRAGGKGQHTTKRMRRAKLFYLREQPAKMIAISSAVKRAS
jgi:large subunit ribosomal protein L19